VQQEMQALQTEYQPRIEELQRQSLQRAWEELRASAQAVADRKGFTYVMMAQDPADDLNASGPDADEDGMSDNPGQEIQKRTVLVAPEGTNITADVRADLNLG
jgi:Skp family chaperone for outer membrane proteins